jgi:hypothetical protein
MALGARLTFVRLLVLRMFGRRATRARSALAIRRALAPRLMGQRPRAFDLRLEGVPVEEIVIARTIATPAVVLDTSSAAAVGLPSVRESVVELPERRVHRLHGGLIHGPTGLVLHRGRHLVQSGPVIAASLKHFASDHHVVEDLWLAERFVDPGVVTVRGSVHHTGPFGRNYYHWLVDVLPRLLHARLSCPELTIVLPEEPRFATASLERLAVPYVATTATVAAEGIIVVDPGRPGWIHPADVRLIRSTFASPTAPAGSDRIPGVYVSRVGDARSPVGEELLERALLERGFCLLRADRLPEWGEQIDLFVRSRTIVGPHGAGLANMLFAAPDTRVVELIPPALNPEGDPGEMGDFLRLATVCGLAYTPVLLGRERAVPYGDAGSIIDRVLELVDR